MDIPVGAGAHLIMNGAVATIAIDQVRRRNALGLKTWRVLPLLVLAAERDPAVRLIVLRGAGRVFGAGNDLSEFAALHGDPAGVAAFGQAMADAMHAVETTSKPVVVAIEGQCYGASVALALAGDLRIAADDASFAITPAKLGAVYLRSDLHRLVAAIGQGAARRLIYTAEAVDAADARAMGLVDLLAPAEDFDMALERLAAAIVRGSPFTLRSSKAVLQSVASAPTPRETPESLAVFVEATQGADFAEGVEAFFARRPPRFGGFGPVAMRPGGTSTP